jgi:large subunit ribosomal protein L15
MARKRKKIVKQRGSKTHGWGSKKKHRGAGSRGGRGRAGASGQKKLWLRKRGGSLGKRGFKSLRQRGLKQRERGINLRDLERLAKGKNEIDLLEHGYERVLGSGEISKPLKIKARYFSAKAKDKIAKAKGEAVNV